MRQRQARQAQELRSQREYAESWKAASALAAVEGPRLAQQRVTETIFRQQELDRIEQSAPAAAAQAVDPRTGMAGVRRAAERVREARAAAELQYQQLPGGQDEAGEGAEHQDSEKKARAGVRRAAERLRATLEQRALMERAANELRTEQVREEARAMAERRIESDRRAQEGQHVAQLRVAARREAEFREIAPFEYETSEQAVLKDITVVQARATAQKRAEAWLKAQEVHIPAEAFDEIELSTGSAVFRGPRRSSETGARAWEGTRGRLLRRLAHAERTQEREEADRARKLLRRAAEQQEIYHNFQKQSSKTRGKVKDPPVMLRPSNACSGTQRSLAFPNVPLFDLVTGAQYFIWNVYKGMVVVMEFYLSTTGARQEAPVIAVDP